MIFDSPTVLMDLFRQPALESLDFGAIRQLLSGGDFVPGRLRVMARDLAGLEVSMAYGLTEAGLVACQPAGEQRDCDTSVGVPTPGTELRIVDDSGREVGCGEPGQILVRSKSQMSGYWQMPELTESVLSGEGWIATGDLGSRRSDGQLEFRGRLKEIIVRDSLKISPLEVEAALLTHPGVRQAGVTGVSDAVHGEHAEAFVVLRENFEPRPSERDLASLAAERLCPYMVPERIHFVKKLLYHASGKLDRAGLRLLAELDEIAEGLG
jgi:long-chain acyl-CoA synthetase